MGSDKRLSRHLIANICLLLAAVLVILILSARENYARQIQQIQEYITVLSGRTAQHVGDVFRDKQSAITSSAYLYGVALQTPGAELEYLAELETDSGFDYIRFIGSDGRSTASDGTVVDVSDRDYFRQGIQGQSGCTAVDVSRFNGDKLVGFYAPVRFDGRICGVMAGFLTENTVSSVLETDLYGHPAFTMLMDADGQALGQYQAPELGTMEDLTSVLDHVQVEEQETILAAVAEHSAIGFAFHGTSGRSAGEIQPVPGSDWSVIQLFPSGAARQMVDEVNNDERFSMLLFAAVLALSGVQFLYTARKRAVMGHDRESRERMISLLQSIADDYICLISVDLRTEQEEQFRIHNGDLLPDWTDGGDYDYTRCIGRYADTIVAPADRQRFREATRLSVLREVLSRQKDFYIEYDAIMGGQRRRLLGKFTMEREVHRSRILVGIRDITERTNERIRNQTSMDLVVSAASTVYPFILEENLTRNDVRSVYNRSIVKGQLPDQHCTMEEMLEALRQTVPEEDYRQIYALMSRQAQLEAYQRGQCLLHIRVRQRDEQGDIHWMETRNILMESIDGDIYSISMTRCVDDEVRRTAELQAAKEAAESSNRAKSTFLFNMSHDIRTPLNAIIGFSDLAEKYASDPQRVVDYLRKIHLSGSHLLKLINSVLDLARIESGKTELDIQAHDIPAVMQNMDCIFQSDLEKKHLTLDVQCRVQDRIAFFDALKMNQIELNLIGNAIKYTPDGGHISYVVEQIAAEGGQATYRGTVTDNGIGMSQEFLGSIFDPFEREHNSVVTGIEGTGLGLTITKRLVEEMGGTITCTSQEGVGSQFVCTFTFPVGTEADLPHEAAAPALPADAQSRRILLVEDNPLNREISRELLREGGFSVEEADDGDVAVDMVRRSQPGYYDLVLMDVQMPRMNGYEAARQIRALPDPQLAAIPILAVTANAFEEDRRAALEAGMNGHLAKPIDVAQLRAAIARLLQ